MFRDNDEHTNVSNVSYNDSYGDGNVKPATIDTERHSRDVEIDDPVDDVDEMWKRFPLELALRRANQETPQDFDRRSEEQERSIESSFDERVTEYGTNALKAKSLDPDSEAVPIKPAAVNALLVKEARTCGFRELSEHFKENTQAREAVGLESAYGKSWYSARNTQLSDAQQAAIKDAAWEAVYAFYHRGHKFPESVWRAHEEHGPEYSPIRMEQKFEEFDLDMDWEFRFAAMRNWANRFLDSGIVEALSFDRNYTAMYPMEAFLGVLAHAASEHTTAAGATKSARGYIAPIDVVPWGQGIQGQVRELSITEISEMLWEANQAFLDFASEFLPISQPLRYAFDLTDIPVDSDSEGDRWTKGYAQPLIGIVEPTEEKKWSFAILGGVEGNARFALRIVPVETGEDVKSASLSRLLRPAVSEGDITPKLVIMDREMVGAKMVTRLRELVGRRWMMGAKKEDEVAKLLEQTPEDETAFYENIDYLNDLSEKPNAFVMPIHEDEERASDSQRVILTDLTPEEVDHDYLNFNYKHRNRIEKTLEQVKNHFKIKLTQSADVKLQYYYLGVQMLLANFHILINNSLSPEYLLPLGSEKQPVTAREVASAVRDEAFKRAEAKMTDESE